MNNLNGVLKKNKNEYWIIASSKAIDRDKEIILPNSFKNIDTFIKTNPVILWAHDYSKPPVGKALDYEITENELKLKIQFADTDFGKEIKYLYDEGYMNTFSVGFIAKNWDYNGEGYRVYSETEILETSAVPVPANAAATMIRQAEERGMELKHFKSLLDESSKDTAKAETLETDVVNEIKNIKRRIKWTK